jgi:hypothetical protein
MSTTAPLDFRSRAAASPATPPPIIIASDFTLVCALSFAEAKGSDAALRRLLLGLPTRAQANAWRETFSNSRLLSLSDKVALLYFKPEG